MAGGKFSLANLFGITIRESANDGSDFTNPDADYRRLFLGEDGLLHVKDSAGAVTSPYTAASGAEFATANAKVATSQGTTSTSYADLTTPGPSVTVTVGASGKVMLHVSARMQNSLARDFAGVGVVVSGANTIAAFTVMIVEQDFTNLFMECGTTKLLTGLTPGSTTFKMQYIAESAGGTATFTTRELIVAPVL